MATQHHFTRNSEESLIPVEVAFYQNDVASPFTFALDTGTTHSVIDIKEQLWLGYTTKDAVSEVQILTGNGRIRGLIFKLKKFEALGVTRHNYEVTAYDFLQFGQYDEYTGMLGLDFFQNESLTFDFEASDIWVGKPFNREGYEKEAEEAKRKIAQLEEQIQQLSASKAG